MRIKLFPERQKESRIKEEEERHEVRRKRRIISKQQPVNKNSASAMGSPVCRQHSEKLTCVMEALEWSHLLRSCELASKIWK